MDWNALKILAQINQSGSMSSAAKALGVNYTTVFRKMEALEQSVGGKLFERGRVQYSPTPLAEELLSPAKEMLAQAEQIQRQIIGKEFLPSGMVKITAPFNIANRSLPRVLKNIRRDYPDIHFQILSSNDEVNLNTRIADIAVRATSSPPQHLLGKKVTTIPWAIYTSQDFAFNNGSAPRLESLSNYPLIGGTGSMLRLPAFQWLEKHHSDAIVYRSDELTAMSHMAEQGLGIAFLPLDQMREQLHQAGIFEPGKTSDLWVLTHPDLRNTKRIRITLDYLTDYFRGLSLA